MPQIPDFIMLTTGEAIPITALDFTTSRSGGPGGQNVNKVETKVEVRISLPDCSWISETTRELLLAKLAPRLDTSGTIRVASSVARTQHANRIEAILRLEHLLNAALVPQRPRVATKPSRGAKERRRKVKRIQAETKASRRWRPEE